MNERKRLYPTVGENRKREHLKRKFGLARTVIAKSEGIPQRTSREEVTKKAEKAND